MERVWRRPGAIETWWTKPVLAFNEHRPCEMPEWEVAELLDKIEEGREISRGVRSH